MWQRVFAIFRFFQFFNQVMRYKRDNNRMSVISLKLYQLQCKAIFPNSELYIKAELKFDQGCKLIKPGRTIKNKTLTRKLVHSILCSLVFPSHNKLCSKRRCTCKKIIKTRENVLLKPQLARQRSLIYFADFQRSLYTFYVIF